jgi:hypothetical protein
MDPSQISKTEVLKQLVPGAGAWLCLAVIFVAICWILFRLRAFWREDAERDATPHEMLAQFQESQREGVLTAEEYRLIKSRLAHKARAATETERRESAAKSTDSRKGIAPSPTGPPADGEIQQQA